MCPACIAAAAWIAAGAGSAGGLTAFLITRQRSRKNKGEESRSPADTTEASAANERNRRLG